MLLVLFVCLLLIPFVCCYVMYTNTQEAVNRRLLQSRRSAGLGREGRVTEEGSGEGEEATEGDYASILCGEALVRTCSSCTECCVCAKYCVYSMLCKC